MPTSASPLKKKDNKEKENPYGRLQRSTENKVADHTNTTSSHMHTRSARDEEKDVVNQLGTASLQSISIQPAPKQPTINVIRKREMPSPSGSISKHSSPD